MGGDLAQPSNELDSQTLYAAITNLSSDATAAYWIGKKVFIQASMY
jgi:hypothetical protein